MHPLASLSRNLRFGAPAGASYTSAALDTTDLLATAASREITEYRTSNVELLA